MDPHPGWTGPPEDRRSYYTADRTALRRGGLGVVCEATIATDRLAVGRGVSVGVKFLTGNIPEERFNKLQARGGALSEVDHPGLARFVEAFIGPPFVTDAPIEEISDQRISVHVWVDGIPLGDCCDAATSETILEWGRQIAEALDVLHRHPAGPFAHRDLHPQNVVIDRSGRAVLIDYDTILVDDSDGVLTGGLLPGTKFAPSARNVGITGAQRDDRWSFALTLLHCLARDPTAELPLAGASERCEAALQGYAADPRGVVDVLRTVIDGTDTTSASAVIDRLQRPLRHRRVIPRLTSGRVRRLALTGALVGTAAIVIGYLALLLGSGRVTPPAWVSGPYVQLDLLGQVGPAGALPLTVGWQVTPGTSGVCSTRLRRSTDGGPWREVPVRSATASTATDVVEADGLRFRYEVDITDCDGGTTGWRSWRTYTYHLLTETSGSWAFHPSTGWHLMPCPQCPDGHVQDLVSATATATLTVASAYNIGVIMEEGPTGGKARVLVDGKAFLADTYAPTVGHRVLTFKHGWSVAGAHTVQIEDLGSSPHSGLGIDGAVVVAGS